MGGGIRAGLREARLLDQEGERRQDAPFDDLEGFADGGILERLVLHAPKARRTGLSARKDPGMTGTASLLLALLMIAGFALTGGGIYRLVKLDDRKRGVLMIVAGLVMWGNVAIMTI